MKSTRNFMKACVIPVMDYCVGVWGYKQYDKHNTVHNRVIRSYLGVHRYASNVAINGDVDWTTPYTRRKICMIKSWNRLVKMTDTRLTKTVFMWDFNSNMSNTWCGGHEHIFTNLNMVTIYENVHLCNETN